MTPLVQRENVEPIVEAARKMVPDMGMRSSAVHRDHRMSTVIAPIRVMQAQIVVDDEPALRRDAWPGRRLSRWGGGQSTELKPHPL